MNVEPRPTHIMTSNVKNDVSIKVIRSESAGKDSNQNNGVAVEKTANCVEPREDSNKFAKKVHQKRSCGKRWLFKLSLADIFIGLLNISFGIAVFIERKKLPHWLTDCAFSMWYGCCVLATGLAGIEYFRRKSKTKGIVHIIFNAISLVLAIPSLAFYGKVITHYHKIREGTIAIPCKTVSINAKCNDQYESLAAKVAALYGILLVSSIVEIFVSFVLCAYSSMFRFVCKKVFLSAEESQMAESHCSMFNPGATYPISSLHSTYHEYHIDQTPLKPMKTSQIVCVDANLPRAPSKQSHRISPQRRPAFKAMESITESIESTDYENEAPAATKEEEEICQRESLLPQAEGYNP